MTRTSCATNTLSASCALTGWSTHACVQVRLALHSPRLTHNGKLCSDFGDEDLVPWSEFVPGYVTRLRATPDASTSNTLHYNTASLVWVMVKVGMVPVAGEAPWLRLLLGGSLWSSCSSSW